MAQTSRTSGRGLAPVLGRTPDVGTTGRVATRLPARTMAGPTHPACSSPSTARWRGLARRDRTRRAPAGAGGPQSLFGGNSNGSRGNGSGSHHSDDESHSGPPRRQTRDEGGHQGILGGNTSGNGGRGSSSHHRDDDSQSGSSGRNRHAGNGG